MTVLGVEEGDEEGGSGGLVEGKTAEESVAFAEREPKWSIVSSPSLGTCLTESLGGEWVRQIVPESLPVSAANACLLCPSISCSLSPHPIPYEPADTGREGVQRRLSPRVAARVHYASTKFPNS